MSLNYIFSYVIVFYGVFVFFITYKHLTKRHKEKIYKNQLIIILFFSAIQIYMGLSIFNQYKLFINLFLNIVLINIIYKDDIRKIFLIMIIIYTIEILFEITYSFTFIILNFNTFEVTTTDTLFMRNLFSLLIYLSILLIIHISKVKKFLVKTIDLIIIKRNKTIKMLIIIFFAFIVYIIFILTFNISVSNYYNNLVAVIIILCCMCLIIIYKLQLISVIENEKIILKYMTKYELLLDQYKINKHEMLNNLILLSSFKNKNSKKYTATLNDIIKKYSEKGSYYNNIAHLPYGIKGILYYKMNTIEKNKLNIVFYCTKNLNKFINEDNAKDYSKLCKLLNIFLDNAIESALRSKKKLIIIDIYKEEKYIVFYIENSFDGNVDVSLLKNKYYSSKGQNRGLGLYVASQLKKQSKTITYKQYINNNGNFVTLLKIKFE